MTENQESINPTEHEVSRRALLKSGSLLGGLMLVGGCAPPSGRTVPQEQSTIAPEREPTPPEQAPEPEGYQFFSEEEARTVDAVVARIIPGDDDDPGAVQAGVTFYIDHKLARFETFAQPTYTQGPFAEGYEGEPPAQPAADTVPVPESELFRYGYQARHTARDIYRLGVPGLDRYSQTRFGSLFADLSEDRQDQVLMVLDGIQQRSEQGGGDVSGGGSAGEGGDGGSGGTTQQQMDQAEDVFGDVDPGLFFDTLRTDTIEGMFADPVYGGNRDLAGWRMIGWPGAQRSYSPQEMLHGTNREPISMEGLVPMNPDRRGQHEHGRGALEQPHSGVREG